MSVNSNPNDYGVNMMIGPNTKFIVSTSGRMSSLLRYKKLLQDILKLDIAYISISPQNHNEAISPVDFVNSLKGLNCIGGAISKDIKNSIIPYLDKLDDLAAKTQAVNTVISKNDELHGYNTDAIGFKIAVEKIIEKYPKKIETAICYGYGGVTSVVVWVLKSLGIKTYITGRRLEEAAKRAEELDAYVWSPETWSPGKAELFVNAAPVSDRPLSEGVNFLNSLKGCGVVFDHEMPGVCLQAYCDENSVMYVSGYDMYYPQMYAQWGLFLDGYVERDLIPVLMKQAEEK